MLARLPFVIHGTVEVAAGLSFALAPQRQLPGLSVEAELILLSYGGLLLSSAAVSFWFAFRAEFDATTRFVAFALAIYHPVPIRRAVSRIARDTGPRGAPLGGPLVHLLVHVVCLVGLLAVALIPIP